MDNAFMDIERRIYDAASLACELKDFQQVARCVRMLDFLSRAERLTGLTMHKRRWASEVESYLANNHRRKEYV